MDINNRVDHMDEELQLLKNEIKQVLLEIQEHVLNIQNPFSIGPATMGKAPAAAPAATANEPVFVEPVISDPEPVAPDPAPAPAAAAPAPEVAVVAEAAAPVAAPAPVAPAPVAAAPIAPAAPLPAGPEPAHAPASPGYVGGGAPPEGDGGRSYVPPPMPSMPFTPPSGGFGGPSSNLDALDRDQDRADRIRDRIERDRDREERVRDRGGDSVEDKLRAAFGSPDADGDSDEDKIRDAFGNSNTSDESDDKDKLSIDFDLSDGRFSKSTGEKRSSGDKADSSDAPKTSRDKMADIEDEIGMPGLPPGQGGRKAADGTTMQSSRSDDEDGGSLGPPGAVFNMPGMNIDGKSVDLVTMAGLIQWAYSVLAKVGSEHMFSILDVSAHTGRIPEETRDILLSVIPIFEMAGKAENVTVKDIIATLAELDSFLGNISPEDTRLLPFLLQDEMDVFPLIRQR